MQHHTVAADQEIGQYMLTDAIPGREQFAALIGVLRQEYAALEALVFKLTEAELLAQANESRFMAMIVDEVDDVAEEVGTIAIARAMIVAEICDALGGLDDDVSLAELIAAAPPEFAGALEVLRNELVTLTGELVTTRARGSAAAKDRLATIQSALDKLEPAAGGKTGYDQWGAQPAPEAVATRFDRSF